MKSLDKGQDKIKRICDELRHETLEPARLEAEKIIAEAIERAEQILSEAKKNARELMDEGRSAIEQERNVFHSSLTQASEQTLEALRQKIEHKFFSKYIHDLVVNVSSAPQVIAQLLKAMIQNIEKEGLSKDFSAVIPKTSSAEEIAKSLIEEVYTKLENHPLLIGNFEGGAQVKLQDKKITLVLTDKELTEFLKLYIRKDFRKLIFASTEE